MCNCTFWNNFSFAVLAHKNRFLRLIKPKGHLHWIGMVCKTVFYICTDFWVKHCSALWENFVIQYWSQILKWWFSVSFSLWTSLCRPVFRCSHCLFYTMKNSFEPVSIFHKCIFAKYFHTCKNMSSISTFVLYLQYCENSKLFLCRWILRI